MVHAKVFKARMVIPPKAGDNFYPRNKSGRKLKHFIFEKF
jgi:hypothetical protein